MADLEITGLPSPLPEMWSALSRETNGEEQAVAVVMLLALFCLQQPIPVVALRALTMSAARQVGAPHLRFADGEFSELPSA